MRTEQQILDSLVTRGLALIRYSNGLQRAADEDLLRLVRDLRVLLAVGVDGIGRRELLALLREIDTVIMAHIGAISERQGAALPGLLSAEAAYAVTAAGVLRPVSERQLELLARDFAVFGLPLAQSWAALARDFSQRVAAEVRTAASTRLPADALITRVLGSTRRQLPLNLEIRLPNRAPRPVMADGSIINPIRRRVRQLSDAVVQTAAGDAQFAAWRANGMNAVKWHAILDAKVCPACGIRAGKLWDLQAKPVAHEVELARRPPAHFWCRCILLPMQYPNGKPPADGGEERDSFEDWIGRRPPEEVEQVLGVGRADLYRRGVITLQDLINQSGQVLTLAQLRAMRGI